MERIRRRLGRDLALATAAGRLSPLEFDPARPWGGVWRAACQDTEFWRKQFEEPAMLIKVHALTMTSAISGDTPVDPVAHPPRGAKRGREEAETSRPKPMKSHWVADGAFTHNRRGTRLCADFQHGRCASAGADARCPKDRDSVHQCAKCLLPNHGAHSPHECGAVPREGASSGRGRGGGKGGKGKGKSHKGKGKSQY